MADQLYLSLWFPNFRLASLPAALTGVLRQFALVARDGKADSRFGRVNAASAYPINWTESPVYQRIYVNDDRAADTPDTRGSEIEPAVAEATEQLHDDTAYEFEMSWMLWKPETFSTRAEQAAETSEDEEGGAPEPAAPWRLEQTRVRIVGFGPDFDTSSYEQNGHVRVDFGLDTPWTFENEGPVANSGPNNDHPNNDDPESHSPESKAHSKEIAERIRENVEKLLAFTLSVEKNCGISSRLLWTESGEPLAEKLVARLQRLN